MEVIRVVYLLIPGVMAILAILNLIVGFQLLKTAKQKYTPWLFITPATIVLAASLYFLFFYYSEIAEDTSIN